MIKNQPIRPAAAAFLLMVAMSLLSTGISFFLAPVCDSMGFARGAFSLYYSLMTAAGAVSVSFLGRYMNRHGARRIILISAFWCGIGFCGLSFCRELWMFYIVGGLMGFFGSSCVYLCANITVQKTYPAENASIVMGLVMAGTGIGGVIWSNFVPLLLSGLGWQASYRVLGLCWTALVFLAFLILGKQQSDELAEKPQARAAKEDNEFVRSGKFYTLLIVMFIFTFSNSISQQLPSLLEDMGHEAASIGGMISVMTAIMAVSTIVEGMLCTRFGIVKTMLVVTVFFASSFILLFFKGTAYIALAGLAFGYGAVGTLLPVVVRYGFGDQDYGTIWSLLVTAGSVTTFLATPAWGMVYDIFGNYSPALIAMTALLLLTAFLLIRFFRSKKTSLA